MQLPQLFAAVLLLTGLHSVLAADRRPPPLTADDVAVDYHDGAYSGRLSLRVAVPPALAIEVLTDFDHMASFVPNLVSSRILVHTGNVYRIAQQGIANFGPFSFRFESERRVELFPNGRLVSQALSGSTKSMHSELQVQPAGTGTRLDYRIDMVPDRWLPSVIGVRFMRDELAEQFSALAHEMERRQQGRAGH